jgi:hypothetical protein
LAAGSCGEGQRLAVAPCSAEPFTLLCVGDSLTHASAYPAGDEALGALLEAWTGQQLGAAAAGWQAWFRTPAFGNFTSPQAAAPER